MKALILVHSINQFPGDAVTWDQLVVFCYFIKWLNSAMEKPEFLTTITGMKISCNCANGTFSIEGLR